MVLVARTHENRAVHKYSVAPFFSRDPPLFVADPSNQVSMTLRMSPVEGDIEGYGNLSGGGGVCVCVCVE